MIFELLKRVAMKNGLTAKVIAFALALAVSMNAWAQTLDEAARQAAEQHDARILSARTVQQGKQEVHVIKLLTKDGVVKTVRITVKGK
ncbi:MAG: hypothetical protein GWP58_00540 [Gammaproteobacteria bacterium]|jgi:outer membrane lipoprotein-sorting protein|nr:hypothetical protein [Gammaproteobacteria bacterium]